MPELTDYLERIYDDEDKPLFEEAAGSAGAGAFRAAYVMIWLSCAESFKRRFREAERRDVVAGKIVGQTRRLEEAQRAIDRFLLVKAKEYGFLTETGYTLLLHVYEMRCVYGHPYEEAPSEEQVTHAASIVVEHVLSQPVRLKHGYCQSLMKSMLEDKSFLDDERSTVEGFAMDILPRIDTAVIPWLLKRYWSELEAIADDPSMKLYFWRGIWFCRQTLGKLGAEVFTVDEWHVNIGDFPKCLVRILSRKELFEHIGGLAQDSLLGSSFDLSSGRPSTLQFIERLSDDHALTERQRERWQEHLESLSATQLRSSGLLVRTCFSQVVEQLKSHNWYTQQPVVNLVVSKGIEGLDDEQLEELGRNILQTADGAERSAKRFLASDELSFWPVPFLRGVLLECFADEANQIRFKLEQLENVLRAVETIENRDELLASVVTAIDAGTAKNSWTDADAFSKTKAIVDEFAWAENVGEALRSKRDSLFAETEVDDG